jgi:cytochrome P450
MHDLPPGPRSTFFTSIAVMREPLKALGDALARYGDPFSLPLMHGNLVLTANPDLVRELFSNADIELFDTFGVTTLIPIFGRQSVPLMSGEPHRRERKLLMPAFHGERMRAYGETIAAAAREAMASLTPGQEFRAVELGQRISLEVIVRAVFGVEERERVQQHTQALTAMLGAALPIFMAAEVLQKAPFGRGPWARYLAYSAEVDRLLYEQIERARPTAGERSDILSMLLAARYEDGSAMRDEDIRDELRTLLIAGHETTSTSFASALEEIHRNEHVRTRLLAELAGAGDAPEELAKLAYLSATVDETLRLHPVVEMVLRRLRRPWRFAGYDLAAGVSVGVALQLVHLREDLYPDPRRFEPQRMIDRKPSPFEFVPFGGGNRRCIGAALSQYELRVALGVILREWTLALREPVPVPTVRRGITLGPKTGVRMQVA